MAKSGDKLKLTLKERYFLKYYLKFQGNGTQAAMKAFKCKDESVAAVIACEYLRKPKFLAVKQLIMDKAGITDCELAKVLKEGLAAEETKQAFVVATEPKVKDGKADIKINPFNTVQIKIPDHAVRHKYLETGLKWRGWFTEGKKDAAVVNAEEVHIYLPEKEPINAGMATTAKTGKSA
jgi:hypothetical protein